jgi:hypothetical protein
MFRELVIKLKKCYVDAQDATILKDIDGANLRHLADNSRFSEELGLTDYQLPRQ